jgi:hypothetical protein
VLKRTIIQRAPGMTGIAFAAAPATAPEGIRVYVGQPQVTDHSERGQLTGERLDTITYLVQQPGLHELPAIRYDWWNPETEQLESKTLPAVSFTATAPPAPSPKPSPARWLAWLPVLILAAATIAFRQRLRSAIQRLRDRIDPPSRRAARAFLHACGRSDPDAALSAWARFRSLERDFTAPPELARQLDALFRTRFGPGPSPADWHGDDLSRAFRASRKADASHPRSAEQLPPLNPASHR